MLAYSADITLPSSTRKPFSTSHSSLAIIEEIGLRCGASAILLVAMCLIARTLRPLYGMTPSASNRAVITVTPRDVVSSPASSPASVVAAAVVAPAAFLVGAFFFLVFSPGKRMILLTTRIVCSRPPWAGSEATRSFWSGVAHNVSLEANETRGLEGHQEFPLEAMLLE
ncbi:hypothetical protein LCGC14_2964830 [marine sediment metagenome]|uniref:Uncharacterized protein n=1 Tax=marine sediment metagenome TaxID=412755 RepID=A0A0F9A2H4_9ZZZZ